MYKKREMEMATLMDDHERGALIAALIHSDSFSSSDLESNLFLLQTPRESS